MDEYGRTTRFIQEGEYLDLMRKIKINKETCILRLIKKIILKKLRIACQKNLFVKMKL